MSRWNPSVLNVLLLLTLSWKLAASTSSSTCPAPSQVQENIWAWTCNEGKCIKGEKTGTAAGGVPFAVCKLNCGDAGALWPKPSGRVTLGQGFFGFYPQNVQLVSISAPDLPTQHLLNQSIATFKEYMLKEHPLYKNDGVSPFPATGDFSGNTLRISVGVASKDRTPRLFTNENYTLSIQKDSQNVASVMVLANTFFGARHGLETLSQLLAYDDANDALQIVDSASIQDGPAYTHRGLSMDTSRSYFPLPVLKKIIDGMSFSKLNMFHWHITDTHSWPMYSKSVPEMTKYGAYAPHKIYSTTDMAELIEYARVRGVKVVPEIDAPAHSGNGWNWGPSKGLGELALCVNKEPWASYCVEPPCGQLNPANPNMYDVLGKIYGDMLELFDHDMFHFGGDEVKLDCWLENQQITDYLQSQGKPNNKESLIGLWAEFQAKALQLYKDQTPVNVTGIVWTSELASVEHVKDYLPKENYAIQIWTTGEDATIPFLVRNGYRVIFSNYDALYLDCGYGAWIGEGNNWCSPYKGWQKVYSNDPVKLLSGLTPAEIEAAKANGQLLGSEAAMWNEQADENSIESKLFPRLAALGERLWTNPSTGWYAAETRMLNHRERMVRRGIHADLLQPEWCHQNEQLCYG